MFSSTVRKFFSLVFEATFLTINFSGTDLGKEKWEHSVSQVDEISITKDETSG